MCLGTDVRQRPRSAIWPCDASPIPGSRPCHKSVVCWGGLHGTGFLRDASPCKNYCRIWPYATKGNDFIDHLHYWTCALVVWTVPLVSWSKAAIAEACLWQEFWVSFSLAFYLTFHRRVSECWPLASKQAPHLLKISLDTQQSLCLEILAISIQVLSFSLCKEHAFFM